jgi:predicted DNA-binding WGR domain protein
MKVDLEYIYDANNAKVWSIELNKNVITIKFGKKGSILRIIKSTFKTEKEAITEYNKKINEKTNKGYDKIKKNTSKKISNQNELKIVFINSFLEYLNTVSNKYGIYQENLYNKMYEDDNFDDKLINDKLEKFHESNIDTINKNILKIQNKKTLPFIKSGIIVKNLNKNLKDNLLQSINEFSKKINVDYHPNTDNKVRDIVHPSLYPLILKKKLSKKILDFWNRPYENSTFQWLPSEFKIDENGKCKIESYINNIPLTETKLYENIEKIFDIVLPEFENSWSYINSLKLYDTDNELFRNKPYKQLSLKNKNLQIITKIVRISLKNKCDLLGAWHVEGMSHENIVATASLTLEQDSNFDAKLSFKRIYSLAEVDYLINNVHQNPSKSLTNFLNTSYVPLGTVNIKDSSLVVFPNSHIHKINMINKGSSVASRTIIVFWLINPNIKIISTKNIAQQDYDIKKAYKNRLELMKERTYYKQTFNQRKLNLCEH